MFIILIKKLRLCVLLKIGNTIFCNVQHRKYVMSNIIAKMAICDCDLMKYMRRATLPYYQPDRRTGFHNLYSDIVTRLYYLFYLFPFAE